MSNKEKAIAIVEAFATGSSKVLDYVSDEKYIQHNLSFPDGKGALLGFFADTPTGITIKIHRVIEEGNLVALHSTTAVFGTMEPRRLLLMCLGLKMD